MQADTVRPLVSRQLLLSRDSTHGLRGTSSVLLQTYLPTQCAQIHACATSRWLSYLLDRLEGFPAPVRNLSVSPFLLLAGWITRWGGESIRPWPGCHGSR